MASSIAAIPSACTPARALARGIANYSAAELRRIQGRRSGEIESILGYDYGAEFIHRDDLVML